MNPTAIGNKLVYIFLPLLALAGAFISLYSLFNWFVVTPGLIPLDQDLANYWLPFLLGIILVGVLISPRLRVLQLSEWRSAPVLYQLAAMLVLIVPTCVAQSYVNTAAGGVTQVKSADMIATAPRTRYYEAASICIDRDNPLARSESTLSGRGDQYLEFKIYVLAHICGATAKPLWVGFRYSRSTDNDATDAQKDEIFHDFADQSQKAYNAFDASKVRYFERLGQTEDRKGFEKALLEKGAPLAASPIILIPHMEAFEARNGQGLTWALYAFVATAVVFLIMLLVPSLDADKLAQARKPSNERAPLEPSFLLTLIVPQREAYGLPILIDINIAVYLAMVFSGLGVFSFRTDDLLAWGANYGPAVHGIGVYRLISSQFVHGGIEHIAANMYGLVVGGLFLMPVLRKAGLIACYLICGLGGSIASVLVHPAVVSVGASGAIMGLWGIVLALALLDDDRVSAARGPIITNCLLFTGLTLAQGFAVPGIDNAAHIGGLVTGVVIGVMIFLFFREAKAKPEQTAT